MNELKAVWLEYPKTGNSGGWSRHAKHRPQPVRHEIITADIVFSGASVFVAGKRKLKLNLYDPATGHAIRADYPSTIGSLTEFNPTAK